MTMFALVTGAGSGIGLALAKALAKQGVQVVATARKPQALAELSALGFIALPLDVTCEQSRTAFIQALSAHTQTLHLLVNNAGYGAMGPVLDLTEAQWQAQFATNVFAVALMTRALLPWLQAASKESKATVLNIGSVSASLVTPFAGAYCASKAALHAISDAMLMELKPLGIQVQLVTTGAVATGFAARASDELQWLNDRSPWWPYRDGILKRANASQDFPTAADAYAKQLVQQLLRHPQQYSLLAGRGARLLPALRRYMPWPWLSRILARKFGLRSKGDKNVTKL